MLTNFSPITPLELTVTWDSFGTFTSALSFMVTLTPSPSGSMDCTEPIFTPTKRTSALGFRPTTWEKPAYTL